MDNLTLEQRRKNMQHIRSNNTKIEEILRKALWNKGYRYRKNFKDLPGKPDIVITKYKIAIFCDGEFFHGKDWEVLKQRLENSNNSEYWINKISKNMHHDDQVNKELMFMGWTVIRLLMRLSLTSSLVITLKIIRKEGILLQVIINIL